MKKQKLINQSQPMYANAQTLQTTELNNRVTAKLFAKFGIIYGSKWLSLASDADTNKLMLDEWRKGLRGLTMEQIKNAIEKCRDTLEWPPSIAEFRRIAFELPDADEAYKMALSKDLSFHVVKKAYFLCGDSWTIRHMSEKDFRERFLKAYKSVTIEVLTGIREK